MAFAVDVEFGGTNLRVAASLPGWRDVPVKEAVEWRLGRKVVLDNDANAAAPSEQRRCVKTEAS